MIEVQWLTGMRPAEVCMMRPIDIDTSGECWIYTPRGHKTEHFDKVRRIAIGPQAQAILRPSLRRNTTAYMFTPAEAEERRAEARHAARETPLTYGNRRGTNRKGTRKLRSCYTSEGYRKAVHYACRLAFPAPNDIKGDRAKRDAWHRQHLWNSSPTSS